VARRAGEAPALEQDLALGIAVDAAYAVEQGRLARAVRPDQAADLPLTHVEGDAVERDHAAEAHDDVSNLQQRIPGRAGKGWRGAHRRPDTRYAGAHAPLALPKNVLPDMRGAPVRATG